jgi:hypothetical protein
MGAALLGVAGVTLAQGRQLTPEETRNLPRVIELKPWQKKVEISLLSETFMRFVLFKDMAKEPDGLEQIKFWTRTSDEEASRLLEFAEYAWAADGAHSRSLALALCANNAGQTVEQVADALTKLNEDVRAYQEQLAGSGLAARLGDELAGKMKAYVVRTTHFGKSVLRPKWREWFAYEHKRPEETLPRWCSGF